MDTQVRLTTRPAVTKNRQPIRGAASAWSAALLLILAILVVYPVIMLLLGALTGGDPVIDGYKLSEASLDNFATVLANPNVHLALANSLIACTGGTAMAVVIGLAFAWIVVRTDTPCKGLIAAAGMLPLFVPPLVGGVAWAILGSPKTGLLNTVLVHMGVDWRVNLYSMPGIIFVFGMYYAPYVYMFTSAALQNMDPSLEEAAEMSGASPFRTIMTVTFPLILPAIAAGWMLAFTLSLDDLVIASFTTGPGSTTLPIRIYSEVRLGVKPEINAICTLIIGLISVVIIAASLASKLSSRHGESAAPL